MSDNLRSLIVHGHFYQPPRENPWTGIVDPEVSASPYRDWNERIHAECYRRNAFARVLDEYNRTADIVDNYQHMSFNFGPTLLSWLDSHHPRTYEAVIRADETSARLRRGHGNAIAQGYNHAILPLCNARDLKTQIAWGVADFKRRFSRDPGALWLPEMAVNDAVMGALVDAGMKFVILSPHQAERVRPLAGGDWTSVSEGNIDRGRCYVYHHGGDVNRSIAVFFYDDVLARAIAFEGALTSSGGLMDRIALAGRGKPMVSVATDGETYGHHHTFGEMGLARAIEVLAPEAGFKTTNFAEFLEGHPPDYQVEIKSGPDGEGTSWSCVHGVGRWYRDCGCHTGGQEDWNQAWRGPLRAAFDHLRDEAAARFEEQAGEFMADPWKARDAYIELILDGYRDKEAFLNRFCEGQLKERERVRALSLLDMQHSALLMYTSCGWFFNDISGIESVQVLKYAGRVMDLMEELELPSVEGSFLEILSEAQSNIAEMGNGADIYRRAVMPIRVRPRGVAAHLALSHLVLDGEESGATAGYEYHTSLTRREEHGRLRMATGRVKLESFATGRTADSAYAAIHLGGVDFYCVVKPFPGPRRFRRSAERVWDSFRTASLPVILRLVQHEFGGEEYGLEHILPEGRQRISEMVFGDLILHLSDQYARLYEDNQRVIDMLQSAGFQLPVELRSAAEYTLGRRFEEEIRQRERSTDPEDYQEAIAIADEVARRNYRIDMSGAELIFSEMITDAVRLAVDEPTEEHLSTAVSLINLASRLRIEPEYDQAQEAIYELVCRGEPLSGPMRAIGLFVGLAPSLIDRAGSWPAGEASGTASAAGAAQRANDIHVKKEET